MERALVFLTEPNAARRKAVLTLLHRVPSVTTRTFGTLVETRRAMRAGLPKLMIGPWSQGGETLLAARATVAGNAAAGKVPQVLILTDTVSSSRISLARQAGDAELIPCDPLDEEGLFNRVTLLLRGAEALYDPLDEERRSALDSALENLPALRRRLVA